MQLERTMTITLNDPIQRKRETREANERVRSCRGNLFGVLSVLGNRVDIYSGSSFLDPGKKMIQRIYLKSAYIRCSMWIDMERVTCLGVQI
jgi:hypothetical protein